MQSMQDRNMCVHLAPADIFVANHRYCHPFLYYNKPKIMTQIFWNIVMKLIKCIIRVLNLIASFASRSCITSKLNRWPGYYRSFSTNLLGPPLATVRFTIHFVLIHNPWSFVAKVWAPVLSLLALCVSAFLRTCKQGSNRLGSHIAQNTNLKTKWWVLWCLIIV